jgi:hypothetical protein
VGWGSVYPLAGVLVDVHELDERLQEAEKIGDPHQCAQTIESQLISISLGTAILCTGRRPLFSISLGLAGWPPRAASAMRADLRPYAGINVTTILFNSPFKPILLQSSCLRLHAVIWLVQQYCAIQQPYVSMTPCVPFRRRQQLI